MAADRRARPARPAGPWSSARRPASARPPASPSPAPASISSACTSTAAPRCPTSSASSARSAPLGREAHFFNVNAADEERRAEVAAEMERVLRERGELGTLRVLLHSLAFGTLKLFVADPMKEAVTKAQMDMTLDVMAHSLVYWTQEVVGRGLMGEGGRIFAMTLGGGTRVLPLLRAGVRGQGGARVEHPPARRRAGPAPASRRTAIRAGVTDTPALQKIPELRRRSHGRRVERNPSRRMTTTEDVARAIVVLSHPDTYWITGNVIGVDGGEEIAG